MSLTNCEDALVAAAKDALPGEIEFENLPVETTPKTRWFQLFSLATDPQAETMGTHGDDRVDSVFQITGNYPIGTGREKVKEDYATILAAFAPGSTLESDGQVVTIKGCGIQTGSRTPLWYKVHFSIKWFAFVPR